MKWKRFKKSNSAVLKNIESTKESSKAYSTARKNGKSVKQSQVIAFKVMNFARAKKAKALRKKRKR